MPRGRRSLVLTGTSADVSGARDAMETVIDLGTLLGPAQDPQGEAGPRTLSQLRANVAKIHRYDGVTAAFLAPGKTFVSADGDPPGGAEGVAQEDRQAYRDPELRLSGSVALPIVVR